MLKVDRSFVSDIDKNEGQRAIVKAVSDLGRAFGMVVMAEGIERQEEAALVRGLGVQGAQGYFFSRPVPATELAGWLQQRQQDAARD
jgi:EAL domain-containing protein (putative c-di-GMP-specific phosphodiesterase class I)